MSNCRCISCIWTYSVSSQVQHHIRRLMLVQNLLTKTIFWPSSKSIHTWRNFYAHKYCTHAYNIKTSIWQDLSSCRMFLCLILKNKAWGALFIFWVSLIYLFLCLYNFNWILYSRYLFYFKQKIIHIACIHD